MKPPPFKMFRPGTLGEALELLAVYADTGKILAGGQSLVPALNLRLSAPEQLIDLGRISELSYIAVDGSELLIGAMTCQQSVLESDLVKKHAPLLSRALPFVGHIQTRSRGTVGGSVAHADPSAEIPLVMAALNATICVRSKNRERRIASAEFFKDALATDLQPDEMIVEARIPRAYPDTKVSFREIANREGDFAIIAVAAQCRGSVDGGERLQLAVGGMTPTPFVSTSMCAALTSGVLSDGEVGRLVREELSTIEPMSDIYASAEYRRELAAVCVSDCLSELRQQR